MHRLRIEDGSLMATAVALAEEILSVRHRVLEDEEYKFNSTYIYKDRVQMADDVAISCNIEDREMQIPSEVQREEISPVSHRVLEDKDDVFDSAYFCKDQVQMMDDVAISCRNEVREMNIPFEVQREEKNCGQCEVLEHFVCDQCRCEKSGQRARHQSDTYRTKRVRANSSARRKSDVGLSTVLQNQNSDEPHTEEKNCGPCGKSEELDSVEHKPNIPEKHNMFQVSSKKRDWTFPELRHNLTTKFLKIFPILANILFFAFFFMCALVDLLNIQQNKDMFLDRKVVSSLIASLDDSEWVYHAIAHLRAKEFEMEEVQKISSSILQSKLTVSNVLVALHLAEFTGDKDLKKASKKFLFENAEQTFQDKAWREDVDRKVEEAFEMVTEELNNVFATYLETAKNEQPSENRGNKASPAVEEKAHEKP